MASEGQILSIELGIRQEGFLNESAPPSQSTVNMHHVPTQGPPPNQHQLEPADSGLAAWKMLFAAFMFEGLLWGLPLKATLADNH